MIIAEQSVSLLISFNPLYMFLYPTFGVSYLAFMNFSLYFLLRALIGSESKISIFLSLLAGAFFLSYGAVLYPLILFFYVLLFVFLGFPLAVYIKKKLKYVVIFLVEILLYFISSTTYLFPLLTATVGTSSISGATTAFHVTNLIFYYDAFNHSALSAIYSLAGLNSVYYLPVLRELSAAALVLILLIATYLNKGRKLFIYLSILYKSSNIWASFLSVLLTDSAMSLTFNGFATLMS